MQVESFTEVRTTNGVRITPAQHFFFDGEGLVRKNRNDGQPDVLNARRSNATLSGRVPGTAKVTLLAGAFSWFSIRSVGKGGSGRTVYLRANTYVVVDGVETTLAALYADANTR